NRTCRSGGVELGVLPQNKRRNLIEFLRPIVHQIPAHSVVQREAWLEPPAVLQESSGVFVAAVERLGVCLIVVAGDADQKVCEIVSCLRAEKGERTITRRVWIDIAL